MSTTHPRHTAMLEAKHITDANRRERFEFADDYAQANRLKFFHLRPDLWSHGITIAYKNRGASKDVFDIAVATTHPSDTFSKQVGRIIAIEHFSNGRRITLRKPKGMSTAEFLNETFKTANEM
jgi:hypothetical protein